MEFILKSDQKSELDETLEIVKSLPPEQRHDLKMILYGLLWRQNPVKERERA